jgi:hypothetical protein
MEFKLNGKKGEATPKPPGPELEQDLKADAGIITTRSANITTLAGALKYSKVDLTVWEVERHVINSWEVTMGGNKTGFGKPATYTNYQVKVWLKRIQPKAQDEALKALLLEFRKQAPKLKPVKRLARGDHLLEVDIFDPHFGKLCWHEEVGENYDINIAARTYRAAVENLATRAQGFGVGRIVFPVGNDFFHSDNSHNTTTKGTPLDVDGRWQKSFIQGRKAVMDSILRLLEIAPVDILMVSGNHDTERVFYLGEVLSGWLSKTAGVTVNNGMTSRKYYRYGLNLIGYTHGNEEKASELPLLMATEAAQNWAQTKFREIHCGHCHHERTLTFITTSEYNAIRVRYLASLTPPDYWHKKKGYEGLKSANAMLWHKTDGLAAQINFNA